jgi:hypothetical protein
MRRYRRNMRHARAILGIAGLLAAMTLTACSTTTGVVVSARHPPVLQSLRDESGWRYTLDAVTSCRVTDAITLVRVVGAHPVRVASVSARYANGQGPSGGAWFTVVAMPADRAWGYAGGSANAPTLQGGRAVAVAGATLLPERTSHRAYALVLHVRLLAHAPAWSVLGIALRYAVGTSSRTVLFRQSLAVPAAGGCDRE